MFNRPKIYNSQHSNLFTYDPSGIVSEFRRLIFLAIIVLKLTDHSFRSTTTYTYGYSRKIWEKKNPNKSKAQSSPDVLVLAIRIESDVLGVLEEMLSQLYSCKIYKN